MEIITNLNPKPYCLYCSCCGWDKLEASKLNSATAWKLLIKSFQIKSIVLTERSRWLKEANWKTARRKQQAFTPLGKTSQVWESRGRKWTNFGCWRGRGRTCSPTDLTVKFEFVAQLNPSVARIYTCDTGVIFHLPQRDARPFLSGFVYSSFSHSARGYQAPTKYWCSAGGAKIRQGVLPLVESI